MKNNNKDHGDATNDSAIKTDEDRGSRASNSYSSSSSGNKIMEPRVKYFIAQLSNVGRAEFRVSGDLPRIGEIIAFGNGLESVVIDTHRGNQIAICRLTNPETISQEL